jgi:ribulose 1,5-bisphosphate synthetase/thiazole synthase
LVFKIAGEHDIIVAGGGAAGVVAAIASARNGADTLLVERYGFLGGAITGQFVTTLNSFLDMRGRRIVGGIPQEVIDRLREMGGAVGHLQDYLWWSTGSVTLVDPALMKYAMLEMAVEAGVKLLLHTTVQDVVVEGDNIKGVIAASKGGTQAIFGKLVVDATGDGDVAAAAGAPYVKGRGDGSMQHVSLMLRMGNVEQEKILDYVRENPDQFIIGENPYGRRSVEETIAQLHDIYQAPAMAGFFKLVKEGVEKGEMHPFSPRGGLCLQMTPRRGEMGVYATNVANVDSTDALSLTRAEMELRRQALITVQFLKKYVPGFESAYLIDVAPQVGVRETRRIIGEYVLTEEDVLEGRRFPDVVAKGSHPADIHSPDDPKKVIHLHVKDGGSYDIPYRCLVPKKVGSLLVAGRCASASHEAMGSARVVGTCMAMGQAAGTAAALCVVDHVVPRLLDVGRLQKRLVEQGAVLFD